jgi:dihydroorotate dehydrogenase (NAD+) catalytic subunit
MSDLSVDIAGIRLRNPTMLASGFLDETGGSMLRVYKAGAGAVVTKSIGPQPRTGYPNPTIVELDIGMLNAIGLPNPGIEEFRDEVKVALDGGAVVIGSVFGKDADEYANVAKRLASYGAAGIELNLSCPHAKGLGTEIAQSTEAVREFTAAVKGKVNVPVFPKLSGLDLLTTIARDPVPPLDREGPPWFEAVLAQLLAHDPRQRARSAQSVLRLLGR